MSRFYYNVQVPNIKHNDAEIAPQINGVIFRIPENIDTKAKYIHIQCNGEEDFSFCDHTFDGRWKGIEYQLYDETYEELGDWITEDEDHIKELDSYMKNARPVAVMIDEDSLMENGYDSDYEIDITYGDFSIEINCGQGEINVHNYTENDLVTEGKLIDLLKPKERD